MDCAGIAEGVKALGQAFLAGTGRRVELDSALNAGT